MIEPDIELIRSRKPLSLIDQTRTITKETLYDFAIEYLANHTYINSKKLAIYYICAVYDLTPTRSKYNEIIKVLAHKFRLSISILIQEGKIERYSNNLYKRVDIAQSLCVDTPKISPGNDQNNNFVK